MQINAFLSGSRKHSSDTSESECEPSSHPSRRLGVVTRGTPSSSRVFGLTEVSLQREGYGDSREVSCITSSLDFGLGLACEQAPR